MSVEPLRRKENVGVDIIESITLRDKSSLIITRSVDATEDPETSSELSDQVSNSPVLCSACGEDIPANERTRRNRETKILVSKEDLRNVFAMLDDLYTHLLKDKVRDLEGEMLEQCGKFLHKNGVEMGLKEYVHWRLREEEKKVAALALKQLFVY